MKKILTAILIAVLASTALLLNLGRNNEAYSANQYTATIGWEGPDTYSFCYHTNPEETNDMMVGMGIEADYNKLHGNTPPYEYYGNKWYFFSGIGWGGSKYPFLHFYPADSSVSYQDCYCWWKIDGIWNEHYFDADVNPYWQGPSHPINQYIMDPIYPSNGYPLGFYPNCAETICGKIGQSFCFYWSPYYPPFVTYIDVQVQPWYIVTASSGPPTTTSAPIYP